MLVISVPINLILLYIGKIGKYEFKKGARQVLYFQLFIITIMLMIAITSA